MNDLAQTALDLTPRRKFLGRVASAMGLGLAGIQGSRLPHYTPRPDQHNPMGRISLEH